MHHARRPSGVLAVVACAGLSLLAAAPASAGTVPPGFEETQVFSGLANPTVVRFAPDGKIYVAEKSGLIKTFDGLGDTTPTVFADLRTKVHNFWDRGLLGMELDFDYASSPYVYVLYTHDAAIGGTAPRWGDGCPSPPGATSDGCVVSGRLSRLEPQETGLATEDVLIEDWCQQYPSHSTGSLEMNQSGVLYASGGDGASFTFVDWGQDGSPVNPCGDPHTDGSPTPPNAEGGALRSQDARTMDDLVDDPMTLDGSVIRVDTNGDGISGNPLYSSTDANARRIVATGLRNPFRFDIGPDGTLWVGDVGWSRWEEINLLPTEGFPNFGWPCYEGAGPQGGYDGANLAICETLYTEPAGPDRATAPYFAYDHGDDVVPGDSCPPNGSGGASSSIAGMRLYDGPDATSFPGRYENALFFADYSRDCIWAMRADADGQPDPSGIETIDSGGINPVWLEVGPDGGLYYADFDGGKIMRIQSTAANGSPNAVLEADPTSGTPPLTVSFDGTASSDPDEDSLDYAWDLDDDGELDDSSSPTPSHTYTAGGSYTVTLRVSDGRGGTGTAQAAIDVGNSPPVPTITAPLSDLLWAVGDEIAFSGSAQDAEQGALPPSALDWDLRIRHCPSNCHFHPVQSFTGVETGRFFAPDHEWRSDLRLHLTATDAGGASTTVTRRIVPRTAVLRFSSRPTGAELVIDSTVGVAPFRRRVIKGSTHTISAPSPQTIGGVERDFVRWSDGGAATHTITEDASVTHYRAHFR